MDSLNFVASIAYTITRYLLNSLWQGIPVVSAVIFVLFIFRAHNAATRYLILFLTLLNLVFLPFVEIFPVSERLDNILPGNMIGKLGIVSDNLDNNIQSVPIFSTLYQNFISVFSRISYIIIFIFSILAIFFMLYRLLKGFIYIKGLRQNLLSLPSEYHHIFERLLKLVNMNRKVSIYASCEIKMPMAVGLKNPIILIPYKILGNLTEEQLSYVMLHELSHIKRWDDWANLVQRIIEVFYFWHPAILWINKRLNLEREIACDDYVITLSNEPKSYARCLTRLIELDISASQKMMANGAAWNKKHITKRFKKIIEDGRDRSSRPSILAVSLAACVLFFAASLFISVMPSVKLVKPSSGLKQIDNQSEMVKVPNPPDTHAYIEKTKPKSKDEKRISSNEANKRIAIESSTEVVKESQKSSHNAHDIPLLETKPPFSDPMKDLSKTDEPVNAPGYDITLEVISPSDYTLESHDDKQAKSFPEEGGSSPSLKRTLSENVKQGIDGIGGFIKEVGESTGKSFSELGNMSSSMGKEIALGTKSNFSNMKRAAVKKLGIAGKNTKKISGS